MADPRIARLRLIRTPTIGPITYRQLIARFGNAAAAIAALPDLAARGGGRAPKVVDTTVAEREIAATEKLGARYLFLDDADYPPLLAELDNAPAAMTVRGDIALASRTTVAMVGARNASAAARHGAAGSQLPAPQPDHRRAGDRHGRGRGRPEVGIVDHRAAGERGRT
jgi:DNA processing protein